MIQTKVGLLDKKKNKGSAENVHNYGKCGQQFSTFSSSCLRVKTFFNYRYKEGVLSYKVYVVPGFLSIVGIGSTIPSPECCCSLPLWVQGGRHTHVRGKGGGPNSEKGTGTLVLYVYYNLSMGFILYTEMQGVGGGSFQRFYFPLI